MSVKAMHASELAQKIINKESLFILDVRNESEFNDWRIEGENVHSINKPYFELLDGIDPVVNQLPKDEEIVVVCAKEGSAQFIAEQLAEAGFEGLSYLKGGMK